jgi:hypothetical protein
MADEIVGAVADAGTPDNAGKPDSNGSVTPPVAPVTAPVAANNGWETEKKAFIADLQKERKARQTYEAQVATHKAELTLERNRVLALSGVNPKSQDETDEAAVRAQIERMYPALGKVTPELLERIMSVAERADSLEEATNHHWANHGRQMMGAVTKGFEKELGGKLTERQERKIQKAYVAEAEDNPEFLRRHEAGDQTLITEFIAQFKEDFLEPTRRNALASQLDRQRPVPSGKDRSIVGSGDKKIDVNDQKAVEDLLVQGFRERGGSFGR